MPTLVKLVFVSIFFLPNLSWAKKVSPFFGGHWGFGGDSMVKITYSDGDTSEIKAGEGIHLYGGVAIEMIKGESHSVDLEGSIGFKSASTDTFRVAGTNEEGRVNFTRFPFDAIVFYRSEPYNFRVGGGLTAHLGNGVSGTDDFDGIDVDVESALGFLVQVDYLFGPESDFAVGLRYQDIEYEVKNPDQKFDGAGVSVGATYYFR